MRAFLHKVMEASQTARMAQLRELEREMLAESREQTAIAEKTRQSERMQTLTTHSSPVYR